MDSKIRADLQDFMNRKITFSILELKGILRGMGYENLKLSGLKTSRGYLLTVEEGERFLDLIVEGEEKFRIKNIQKTF